MKTIDELVFGHAQAKKVLKALINRSQERYYKKCVLGQQQYPDRLNCLLIGPSGTGKTHLMRSMAELYKFPLLCIDATELTPSGNDSGINKKQLKKLILDAAKNYTDKPQYHSIDGVLNQMIIFVDEFDKLATRFDSSGNWNKHVQSNFLTMIEDKEELNGISWVFAGAFSGLRNKSHNNEIGFFSQPKQIVQQITERDIISAGIIPEMLGRISLIVQLDDFKIEDYVNIVDNFVQTKYNKLLNIDVKRIAEQAMISGQGIRSIIRQLELALIDHESEQPWIMPTF